MSNDWKRDATEVLISAYKKHPVLYDMRHPRYYNKTVRADALHQIAEDVRQERPKTTMKDVVRKIQTLRTQFGQELTKMRRHSQNGAEYQPTVWWYQGLHFLQHHIRPRTGPNLPQVDVDSWKQELDDSSNSIKVSIVRNSDSVSPSELNGDDYEHSEEEMEYETEVHYEINAIDIKDMKALELKPIQPGTSTALKRKSRIVDRQDDRKVARVLAAPKTDDQQSNRALSPAAPAEPAPTVFAVPEPSTEPSTDPLAEVKPFNPLIVFGQDDRHKSFGHFVGAQMSCLKDDYIYYETQSEMLTIMSRGILRQLALDKKNSAKAGQESNKEKE